MNWIQRMLLQGMLLKLDNTDPSPKPADPNPNPGDKDIEALRQQNADLLKRLEALEGKNNPPAPKPADPPQDINEAARKAREAAEQKAAEQKAMENALKFTMGAADWLETNEALLPKEIKSIFDAANKERYSTEVEKANTIKVGVIQEFFGVQSNLDLLTAAQKNTLDNWKNYTKDKKHEQVQSVWELVFEPTFESLRRERKAEQLRQSGNGMENYEKAYEQRMIEQAKAKFLKKKG